MLSSYYGVFIVVVVLLVYILTYCRRRCCSSSVLCVVLRIWLWDRCVMHRRQKCRVLLIFSFVCKTDQSLQEVSLVCDPFLLWKYMRFIFIKCLHSMQDERLSC